MPLVLTLKEGDDFYIADRRFVLEKVHDNRSGRVRDLENDTAYEITYDQSAEVLGDVMICTGDNAQMLHVVIDAPREVNIVRGELKRRGRR